MASNAQQTIPIWALMNSQAQALGPDHPMSLAQNTPTDEQLMSTQYDQADPSLGKNLTLTPEEQSMFGSQEDMDALMAKSAQAPTQSNMPSAQAIARTVSAQAQGPASQAAVPYDQMMRDMAAQYGVKSKEALDQQQQGIKQLSSNIDQVRGMPMQTNWAPAAAYLDYLNPGMHLAEQAASLKPENQQDRAQKLIALQEALQNNKEKASKDTLSALKEQIDAYKASKIDPLDVALKNAKIGFYGQGRQDLQDQRLGETAYRGVLANINNNKALQTKLQQVQGIDNAGAMIENAPEVTPQLFHDYQQAVVAAVNRGNSGIGERAERYLSSAGIDADKIKQYLAGQPMDIGKNDPMLKAVQGFAQTERGNIEKQYGQMVDTAAKSSGQDRWLNKYPAMRQDLIAKTKGMKDMIGSPAQGTGGGASAPAVGSEIDGYIFNGGDPADANSWSKK